MLQLLPAGFLGDRELATDKVPQTTASRAANRQLYSFKPAMRRSGGQTGPVDRQSSVH